MVSVDNKNKYLCNANRNRCCSSSSTVLVAIVD